MKLGLTRRDLLKLAGKTTLAARLYSIPAFGESTPIFNGHPVLLDAQGKILPWAPSKQNPYDYFLRLRWDFIKTKVPMCPGPAPRSSYPQYYFYCAFWDRNGKLEPDTWMNDVAEKVPNWFESARLYYAYTGDASVMTIRKVWWTTQLITAPVQPVSRGQIFPIQQQMPAICNSAGLRLPSVSRCMKPRWGMPVTWGSPTTGCTSTAVTRSI